MLRAKFDKEKADSSISTYLEYDDGQYLYYGETTFRDKKDATIFKNIGSAKGKMTVTKREQKEMEWYSHLKDIEVIEVEVMIPGDE